MKFYEISFIKNANLIKYLEKKTFKIYYNSSYQICTLKNIENSPIFRI